MTPAQVEEQARRRYNAYADNFWTQDEVFKLIYQAEMILATEALVIEDKDTSITTVASTRAYSFPTGTIAIKRLEYDGEKLKLVDFREDDALTLNDASVTVTGTPQYYSLWNDTIYLRDTPDSAETLTIYRYKEPTILTTSSTSLSVPTRCHIHLCDYVVAEIAAKDGNLSVSDRYWDRWEKYVLREKAWTAKKKRTDGFAVVKDEESLPETIMGAV